MGSRPQFTPCSRLANFHPIDGQDISSKVIVDSSMSRYLLAFFSHGFGMPRCFVACGGQVAFGCAPCSSGFASMFVSPAVAQMQHSSSTLSNVHCQHWPIVPMHPSCGPHLPVFPSIAWLVSCLSPFASFGLDLPSSIPMPCPWPSTWM